MTEDFEMTGKYEKYPEYNNIGNDELIREYDRLNAEDYDSLSGESKERLEYVKRLTEDMRMDSDVFWGALNGETRFKGEGTSFYGNMIDFINDEVTNETSINEEYKETVKLFNKLDLEEECGNPNFVKWLMDKKSLKVRWISWGGETDYIFEFLSTEDSSIMHFSTVENPDYTDCVRDIRKHYDIWKGEELNKILKRVGIVTAVGVSLISVITGLSLGLKRKGHDLVRDSKKVPWRGLKSASHEITPWKEITGEGLIIVGDNIYLVIGGVCVGVYFYRKKNK